jgi:hypothetical protein
LHFHATWLQNLKLVSREAFCREVLKRAGVAEGSIETLLKAAAKPLPGSVPSSQILDDTNKPAATKDAWRQACVNAFIDEGVYDPDDAEAYVANLRDEDIDLDARSAGVRPAHSWYRRVK